jgi:ABC-type bacteriocin/lantibiotic exporter with double-glycine peptidase domain
MSHRVGPGRQTLRNISLTAAPGRLVAIVGTCGAGKTMLLDILAGVRTPVEGRVRYDGVDRHANRGALGGAGRLHRALPTGGTAATRV